MGGKAFFFVFLARERPHGPAARDIFLCGRVHAALPFAQILEQRADAPGVEQRNAQQRRRDGQQRQRKARVDEQQKRQRKRKAPHALEQDVHKRRREVTAPIDVARKARHEVSRAVAVEESHLLMLQLFVQAAAQIAHKILRAAFKAYHHQVAQPLQARLRQHHRQQ